MTLRARLTWILLATLVPLGLAVGCGLYVFVRSSLYARLDDALTARAEALAAAVKSNAGQIEFDFEDAAMPQYQPRAGEDPRQIAYFEIWKVKGATLDVVIERSTSLGVAALLGVPGDPARERTWNTDLPGDVDVRVLARRIVPAADRDESKHEATGTPEPISQSTQAGAGASAAGGSAVLIVVAVSRDTVDGPLEVLTIGLLCAAAVLTVVAWLALRWAIAKGLAPVSTLAEQVAAIDAAGLGSVAGRAGVRLRVDRLPSEIAPIQERVNALLIRIEAAMQREKRFTTAAAHELRTPVAELRTLLEVAASRPRTTEEANRTLLTSLACVERLDRLVSALLRLTRIEAGRETAKHTTINVFDLIEKTIEAVRPIAEARRVQFRTDLPREMSVHADSDLMGLALSNLIANAAEYADEGSTVQVVTTRDKSGTTLRMSNSAASLATVDVARLGEALWRPDQARVSSDHLGLGLTLARSALAASGARGTTMTIRVEPATPPRFEVEVLFTGE